MELVTTIFPSWGSICSDIGKIGCDVMGTQETRRRGQGAVSHGKHVVVWSGARDRTVDKVGGHGVGLAINERFL